MNAPSGRMLFWLPRALAVLFTLFVSLFALDVFGEGYDFWTTIGALLIHLFPTGLLLVALAVAWRWEQVGGLLFIGLGALYLAMSWGGLHWSVCLVMSGIPSLVGILFLVDWRYRAGLRAR